MLCSTLKKARREEYQSFSECFGTNESSNIFSNDQEMTDEVTLMESLTIFSKQHSSNDSITTIFLEDENDSFFDENDKIFSEQNSSNVSNTTNFLEDENDRSLQTVGKNKQAKISLHLLHFYYYLFNYIFLSSYKKLFLRNIVNF